MEADHAARMRGLRAELHDRHRRGVRGQELGVGQDLVEPPEDVALQRLVLDHRLDGGVGALDVGEVAREGEPVDSRLAVAGVQLAGLHGAVQRALDRGLGAGHACVVGLHDGHVDAGAGAHLGDSRAHQATTHDTNSHRGEPIF
jgi:hypothetical protein